MTDILLNYIIEITKDVIITVKDYSQNDVFTLKIQVLYEVLRTLRSHPDSKHHGRTHDRARKVFRMSNKQMGGNHRHTRTEVTHHINS